MTFKLIILFFSFSGFSFVRNLDDAPKKNHPKGAEVRLLSQGKSKSAFMGHLTVPAGGKVPLHRDATEEMLYVLSGRGSIFIDEKEYKIKKDDFVYMPPKSKVRFENGNQPLEVLQVFAPLGPEKKYNGWKSEMKPGVKKK